MRLVQRYQALTDLLGTIVFGNEEVDIDKIRSTMCLPRQKQLAGQRIVGDIIAIGGIKTY